MMVGFMFKDLIKHAREMGMIGMAKEYVKLRLEISKGFVLTHVGVARPT